MPPSSSSRPSIDLVRLSKLLSLVGSDQDGEALSAARQAHRLITTAGYQWGDLLKVPARAKAAPPPPDEWVPGPDGGRIKAPLRTWAATAEWLATRRAGRNARERNFVDRMATELRRGSILTTGNAGWLVDIYQRHGQSAQVQS